MKLEVRNVACGYGNRTIVRNISLDVSSGEILCLLGPNGVGKTTLFKSIMGFIKLQAGDIWLDGEDVRKWPKQRLAQAIGYVPQAHTPPFPFRVLDVVTMGRTAHLGLFASPSRDDIRLAEKALDSLGISFIKDCIYTEISGGERQMVLIARALTQEPSILFMDEPTSNLDFGNQIRVLEQINRLAQSGLGVVMTSHFPNHAYLCSTKVALLQKDDVFKVGLVDEIVTEKNLKAAYDVDVKITGVPNHRGELVMSCVPMLGR